MKGGKTLGGGGRHDMHSDGFTGLISDEAHKSILSETQSTVEDAAQHTEIGAHK